MTKRLITAKAVANAAAAMVRAMHASASMIKGEVVCVICRKPFRSGHNSNCAWHTLVQTIKDWEHHSAPTFELERSDAQVLLRILTDVYQQDTMFTGDAARLHNLLQEQLS